MSRKQLASLKEKDPEFYAFLEKEDQGLLNISDDDEEDEQVSDDSEDERPRGRGAKGAKGARPAPAAKGAAKGGGRKEAAAPVGKAAAAPAAAKAVAARSVERVDEGDDVEEGSDAGLEDDDEEEEDDEDEEEEEEEDEEDEEDEEEEEEEEEDAEEDGEADDDEEADEAEEEKEAVAGVPVLSSEQLTDIVVRAMKNREEKAVRQLIHAFRAAAFMTDVAGGDLEVARTLKYQIVHPGVYQKTVLAALHRLPLLLADVLGPAREKGEKKGDRKRKRGDEEAAPTTTTLPADLTQCRHYPRAKPMIRATLNAVLHLVPQVQDRSLLLFTLRSLRGFFAFFVPFPKLARLLVRALLNLWGETEDEGVRVVAFMRLRQVLADLPAPHHDLVLRGLYRTYLRFAKFVRNETDLPRLALMSNCLVDAYAIHPPAAYQHIFVYLRQLAIHLRTALTTRAKVAVQRILSWQYLNALRLWTAVLRALGGTSEKESTLHPLLFPLVQLILGAARLQPGPTFFPLRLHLAELLIELGWANRVFVPTAPLLLEVLHSPLFSKTPAKEVSMEKPPNLRLLVRASPAILRGKPLQELLVNRTLDLLLDALRAQFHTVAFPELAAPILLQLRTFAKATRVPAWRIRARALVQAAQTQCDLVLRRRGGLTAAPRDTATLDAFLADEAAQARKQRLRRILETVEDVEEDARRAAARVDPSAVRSGRMPVAAKAAKAAGKVEDEDEDEDEDEGVSKKKNKNKKNKKDEEEDEEDEEEEDEDESKGKTKGKGKAAGSRREVATKAAAGKKAAKRSRGAEPEDEVADLNWDEM